MSIRIGFDSVRLIGTILFLFVVASAASGEPAQHAPSRIAYSDNYQYPPFSMIDEKGLPTGFNIDLIRAIGRELGIDVEVRLMPWNQVRSALETEHSADVSAMFYSAERDRVFDFAVPLATEVYQIFLRQDSPSMDSLEKLNGKQVLVEDRSHAAEYVSANYPGIHLIPVESEPRALRMLSSGQSRCGYCQPIGRILLHRTGRSEESCRRRPAGSAGQLLFRGTGWTPGTDE